MSNIDQEKVREVKIRKNYIINESTVRMISELKLINPEVNVRASHIVEKAIRHYYKYIKEEKSE